MSLIKVNQLSTLDAAVTREVTANTGLKIPNGESLSIEGQLLANGNQVGSTGQYLTVTNNGQNVSWQSLPQDISPTSSVTFDSILVTGNIEILGNADFKLTAFTTANLTEGTNLYYTDARVDNRVSQLFSTGDGITSNTYNISFIIVSTGGVSEVTTLTEHEFSVGDTVSIKGSSNGDLNGIFKVLSNPPPTSTKFTIFVDDPELVAGTYSGGTASTVALISADLVIDGDINVGGTSIGISGGSTSTSAGASSIQGASGDPNVYTVSSVTQVTSASQNYLKLTVSDISKFTTDNRVRVFGIGKVDLSTLSSQPNPGVADPIVGDIATYNLAEKKYYAYATSNFNLENGWYSAAKSTSSTIALNVVTELMDENNYNLISVSRNTGNGVLLYRAEYDDLAQAQTSVADISTNASDFKLCAVIGPRLFGNSNQINYADFADFDKTSWSKKNPDGTYPTGTVHFPVTAPTTLSQGWVTSGIFNIDPSDSSFWLSTPNLYYNSTLSEIKVYHDDTKALQDSIDAASTSGSNYLVIPGGTYLVSQLKIPPSFSISGYGEATILKKQYWDTSNINSSTLQGARAAMIVSASYNNTIPEVDPTTGANVWGLKRSGFNSLTFDGNSIHQIQYGDSSLGEESNNSLIHLVNSEFIRIQNTKIINSSGPALFATGSTNLTINSCIITDGTDIEFFASPCVIAQDCSTTVVSNTLFQNYPGAVDFSTTTVLSVNGCTIRNCGTGLRVYGSGKTDVLNNLILGPSDEFIPVPETTDTQYNGVNISVIPGQDGFTPVYQYNISGVPVDLSLLVPDRIRMDVYPVSVVVNGEGVSQDIIDFDNPIRDSGGNPLYSYFNPNQEDDPELGQIRFKIPASKSSIISLTNPPGPNTFNVYEIIATNYTDIGDDTTEGSVLNSGTSQSVPSGVGALSEDIGANSYYLSVSELLYSGVVVGDYIKLIAHDYQPDVGTSVVWKVAGKSQLSSTQFFLYLLPNTEDTNGELSPVGFGGLQESPSTGGGYAQFREIFSIARGIVSIV